MDRELINSVGTNIISTTGNGLSLVDGVHSITTMIDGTIAELAYMFDGTVYYKTDIGAVTGYVIDPTNLQGTGIYSNFIFTTVVFSTEEKTALEAVPETFLYVDTGVVTSEVLVTTDNIVGWLPTLESGSIVYDMIPKSGNGGIELVDNTNPTVSPIGDVTINVVGNIAEITNNSASGQFAQILLTTDNLLSEDLIQDAEYIFGYYCSDSDVGNNCKTYIKNSDPLVKIYTSDTLTLVEHTTVITAVGGASIIFENIPIGDTLYIRLDDISVKSSSGGEIAIQEYDITGYTSEVNVDQLSTGIQAIKWALDSNGMPTGSTASMEFSSSQSEQVVVELGNQPVTGNGIYNKSEHTVAMDVPIYDSGDATHVIVTDRAGLDIAVASSTIRAIFLTVGVDYNTLDYANTLKITVGGAAGDHKWLLPYDSVETHPAGLLESEMVNLHKIEFWSEYITLHRIANYDYLGKAGASPHTYGWTFGMGNASNSNCIINKCFIYECWQGIYFYGNQECNNTVIQNCRIEMNWSQAAIDAQQDERMFIVLNSADIRDTKILNTEFINGIDMVQLQLGGASSDPKNMAGTIVDYNNMWHDTRALDNPDVVLLMENFFDFKNGADDGDTPIMVTNNMGFSTLDEGSLQHHYRSRNIHYVKNIFEYNRNVRTGAGDQADLPPTGNADCLWDNNVFISLEGVFTNQQGNMHLSDTSDATVTNNVFKNNGLSWYGTYNVEEQIRNVTLTGNTIIGGYYYDRTLGSNPTINNNDFYGTDLDLDHIYLADVSNTWAADEAAAGLVDLVVPYDEYSASDGLPVSSKIFVAAVKSDWGFREVASLFALAEPWSVKEICDGVTYIWNSNGQLFVDGIEESYTPPSGKLVMNDNIQAKPSILVAERTLYEVYSGLVTP